MDKVDMIRAGVGQTPNDEIADRMGLYTVDESN